jgi:hypothetical protein
MVFCTSTFQARGPRIKTPSAYVHVEYKIHAVDSLLFKLPEQQ